MWWRAIRGNRSRLQCGTLPTVRTYGLNLGRRPLIYNNAEGVLTHKRLFTLLSLTSDFGPSFK